MNAGGTGSSETVYFELLMLSQAHHSQRPTAVWVDTVAKSKIEQPEKSRKLIFDFSAPSLFSSVFVRLAHDRRFPARSRPRPLLSSSGISGGIWPMITKGLRSINLVENFSGMCGIMLLLLGCGP
jgi:hypothetical protein